MKSFWLGVGFCICLGASSLAQSTAPKRNVRLKPIAKDSVHLVLNEEYLLIEDSCAKIIRQTRFNFETKRFYGKFKDISAQDHNLVLGEGAYTADGLKDGPFFIRHPDGSPWAKGAFMKGNFVGKWELFYPGGAPMLVFEPTAEGPRILEYYTEDGKREVTNGEGTFTARIPGLVWTGKLVNGRPDGTWKGTPESSRSNATFSERFKEGKFVKGTSPAMQYTNGSRIQLLSDQQFLFLNAELIRLSYQPCNATSANSKKLAMAQFKEGAAAYNEHIKRLAGAYLSTVELHFYEEELNLEGIVNTDGRITKLFFKNAFNQSIAMGLIRQLTMLPPLQPALVNGAPVTQPVRFTFKFTQGWYSFSYRLLPPEEMKTAVPEAKTL